MKLVIHIGSHKAGSTTIQKYCHGNTDKLARKGIYYPKELFDKYPIQHSELASLLKEDKIPKLKNIIEQIVSGAANNECGIVFISGENLSTIDDRSVNILSKVTKKYFEQQSIILILRNKKDYIYSQYKHHLRFGNPIIESKFNEEIKYSPANCVKVWARGFNNKIKVLNFEHMKKSFLNKFFNDVFGVSVEESLVENQSLDYLTLIIYNAFIKQYKCREIDKILWDINIKHPRLNGFEIESKVASALNKQFPIEDWISPKFSKIQYSLLEDYVQKYNHDPVDVCERFKDLFGQLSKHFQLERRRANNISK